MMLQGILYVLCLTCLPLCPNACNPTLPTFKSEETEFLCCDRHAHFLNLNVISTRAVSFHYSAR